MPYIRGDEEMYDEMKEELGDDVDLGERPSGEYEFMEMSEIAYEPEGFDPDKLPPITKNVLEQMRKVGVTHFRIRYDGGHDEGFSHPDSVTAADGSGMTIEALIDKLATPQLAAELRKVAEVRAEGNWQNIAEYYKNLSDAEVVKSACDELAEHIVVANLGNGYGTGEYTMYGEIIADLVEGTFTDDPNAAKPDNMELD
jgi:hypothetical protein